MPERAMSLRLRLALMTAALFALGMVALYLAARSYALVAADRSYDRLLAGSALSIAETISVSRGQVSVDIPYAALDMLSAAPDDRVFYSVTRPDGEVITGYQDIPGLSPAPGPRARMNTAGPSFFDARYRGENVRFAVLGRQIASVGGPGWVWVQVGQTRLARESLQQELVLRAVAPIILMTLLALALVWFGISGALRPLRQIGHELERREPRDLRPLTAPVPSEIAPMIRSMNGFMQRLQGSIDRLQTFIADAAHQMRTPLAALLAQAQVGRDGNAAELRDTLERIERNASRLTRLVNQLLSDAAVQYRANSGRSERFDLLETLQGIVRGAVPQVGDSDLRLKSSIHAAPFTGDQILIGEAVKNLIDNALRHGPGADGEVLIRLDAMDAGYLLVVEDRGPGISDALKQDVFARFARGPSGATGAGLGLSIAKEAIECHGGSIALLDRPGGGLRVEMQLPVAWT